MRLELSKKWYQKAIAPGEVDFVEAGVHLATIRDNVAPLALEPSNFYDLNIAFGRFVKLMRRKMGSTIESLALSADIDVEELLEIEDNLQYRPDIRSVVQLAKTFSVDKDKMLQMANLVIPKDRKLFDEAIRFAARSEPVAQLTSNESLALDAFVAFLSKKEL